MFAVADGVGEGCKEVGTSLWEDVIKELMLWYSTCWRNYFQRFHTQS